MAYFNFTVSMNEKVTGDEVDLEGDPANGVRRFYTFVGIRLVSWWLNCYQLLG